MYLIFFLQKFLPICCNFFIFTVLYIVCIIYRLLYHFAFSTLDIKTIKLFRFSHFTLLARALQKRKQKVIFFHRKFSEKKENEKSHGKESGRECGVR